MNTRMLNTIKITLIISMVMRTRLLIYKMKANRIVPAIMNITPKINEFLNCNLVFSLIYLE